MTTTQLANEIWQIRAPLVLMGAHLGTCTTVVRLPSGGLWVHSPGPDVDELQALSESQGPVQHIVAPNRFHYLFVKRTCERFADARVHIAPGLEQKKLTFEWNAHLTARAPAEWSEVIEQCEVRGAPKLDEYVFCHRPSRTLILTDLAFNVSHSDHFWTRSFLKLSGGYGGFGPSKLAGFLLKDRQQVRQSLRTVAAWDFDRILVTHGDVLESGGAAVFRDRFARYL